MKTERVIEHIVGWLKDYAQRTGQRGFVVGVSGGIDSAVTSAICARTGLDVLCVEMPIHQAASQVQRAFDHITELRKKHANVRVVRVELTAVFDALVGALPPPVHDRDL